MNRDQGGVDSMVAVLILIGMCTIGLTMIGTVVGVVWRIGYVIGKAVGLW